MHLTLEVIILRGTEVEACQTSQQRYEWKGIIVEILGANKVMSCF